MHIYISKLSITGSDNGLSLAQNQAIIWTNDGILSIRTVGTNSSEILSKIHNFQENAIENVIYEMAAILSQPQCVNPLHAKFFRGNKIYLHFMSFLQCMTLNILKDCHLGHLKLRIYGPIKFSHHEHGHML